MILYIVDIRCMHLAGILGVYISYSNSVVLSIGTIYRFDGSGNEIKLAKLPVLQLMFPLTFLLYLHSFNLFYRRAIKRERKCFHSCCRRENAPQKAATAPPSRSHHVTAPLMCHSQEHLQMSPLIVRTTNTFTQWWW